MTITVTGPGEKKLTQNSVHSQDSAFQGNWISGRGSGPLRFRKDFTLNAVDPAARIRVCGLGYFICYLNGHRVGCDYFVPDHTDYGPVRFENPAYPYNLSPVKSVHYLVYEVSSLLSEGKNQLEIQLGSGWYRQRKRDAEGIMDYGPEKCILQLVNGETVLSSDESWDEIESPYLADDLFIGEVYDARLQGRILGKALLTEAPQAAFTRQTAPADRILETITPSECLPLSGNASSVRIFDSGVLLTGFARISCRGKRGTSVRLRFAECLDADGKPDYTSTLGYNSHEKNQIQEDRYILCGSGVETYCPQFVWHAFRYVEVQAEEGCCLLDLQILRVGADMKQTGHFHCSDERLNRLYEACVRSQISSVHGAVPMDCPHRERMPYTGDGQNACSGLMLNFDAASFYRKWIRDIRDAQNPDNGYVPHTAPYTGGGGGPSWGSAVVFVPWQLFLHTQDREILSEMLPSMHSWISYLCSRRGENGLVDHEEDGHGCWCLGEWVLPSKRVWSQPQKDLTKIPDPLVNTCMLIECMQIADKAAGILGKAPLYEEEILRTSASLNRSYLKKSPVCCYASGLQGCDVFPLYLGIVPEAVRDQVLQHLISHLEETECRIDTGMFGTPRLLTVLHRAGRDDLSLRLLTQPDYPGYGYMLKNGATAIWETWEGTGSRNHTALTGFSGWFFSILAGITPSETEGYRHLRLEPLFPDSLTSLEAELAAGDGSLHFHWTRTGSVVSLSLSLPKGCRADLILPGNTAAVSLQGPSRFLSEIPE